MTARGGGMAAAAAAVSFRQQSMRRKQSLVAQLKQSMRKASAENDIEIVSEMPQELVQDVHKSGAVLDSAKCQKLASNYTWVEKLMTLTEESLFFQDANSQDDGAADYIPLHEIVQVRFSTHVSDHITHDEQEHDASQNLSGRISANVEARFAALAKSSSYDKVTGKSGSFGSHGPKNFSAFDVLTQVEGVTCGRVYTVKMENRALCEQWIQSLNKHAERRLKEVTNLTTLQSARKKARRFYNSFLCQLFVAIVILFNFVVNAIQAEYEPLSLRDKTQASPIYEVVDIGLTIFFCVELGLNLFGNWFWDFFLDGWSVFDLLVVTVSVLSLALENIPGVNILRVLRAFRILRLIKRFESLRQIMHAIILSIIPVLNALLIGMMVTTIYTIIGVYLFAHLSEEKFGTFGRAMYTLFELTAFTIWPSTALPAFKEKNGALLMEKDVVIFVVSYMAVVVWTLLQVVVAVLLDNFMCATAEDKALKAKSLRAALKKVGGVFDPLLQKLSATVDTEKELAGSIQTIWHVIDVDGEGRASFEQMREGLLKLNLSPRVRLTQEDYAAVTESYALCDDEGKLSKEAFGLILNQQLRVYVQRHLSDAAALCSGNSEGEALLQGLRQVLMVQSPSSSVPHGSEDAPGTLRSTASGLGGMHSPIGSTEGRTPGVSKRLAALEESVGKMKAELAGLRQGQEEGFKGLRADLLDALAPLLRTCQGAGGAAGSAGAATGGVADVAQRERPGREGEEKAEHGGLYESSKTVPSTRVFRESAVYADLVADHRQPGGVFSDRNGPDVELDKARRNAFKL